MAFIPLLEIFSSAKIIALDEYDGETLIETATYDPNIAETLNRLRMAWTGEKTEEGTYLWRVYKE
jgi:hypothetical protein